MRIGLTSIFVDDQDQAEQFYTQVLGFQVKTNAPYGEERWLSVVSPEDPDGVELVLHLADAPARAFQAASRQAGRPVLSLHTDDCAAQVERLKAKGWCSSRSPGGRTTAASTRSSPTAAATCSTSTRTDRGCRRAAGRQAAPAGKCQRCNGRFHGRRRWTTTLDGAGLAGRRPSALRARPGPWPAGRGRGRGRPVGEVLATVGGVVTMAGLVLLVQNATDRFDTWAYAWTLVVLVGPGIGRWLLGVMRGRGDLAASGGWLIAAGLLLVGRRLLAARRP